MVAHWSQHASVDVPMRYACGSCQFEIDVLVRGRGMGAAMAPGEELEYRAVQAARKSAERRCGLWPCPRCGARSYGQWRKEWIKTALILFLFSGPGIGLLMFAVDTRNFERNIGDYLLILAGLTLFCQLVAAFIMLAELRASRTAVRPIA